MAVCLIRTKKWSTTEVSLMSDVSELPLNLYLVYGRVTSQRPKKDFIQSPWLQLWLTS